VEMLFTLLRGGTLTDAVMSPILGSEQTAYMLSALVISTLWGSKIHGMVNKKDMRVRT